MRYALLSVSVFLAGCTSISRDPAPPPGPGIEVRAAVEADGSVGVYAAGQPILPVYRVVGKFTARAVAAIPPSLHIYLEGDAYIEPTSGAHIQAVRDGQVVIYRDGVPIEKMGAGFALPQPAIGDAPVNVSPGEVPPAGAVVCPDGKCNPPLPWDVK